MIHKPLGIKLRMTFQKQMLLYLFAAAALTGACNRSAPVVDPYNKPATTATTHPGEADEGPKVKLTSEAIETYGVKVGKVKKHLLVPSFVVPARVAFNAEAMARVGSIVAGRVVEMKAKAGDAVKKGDVLLVIESTDLGEAQSDLLQKRNALDAATSAVETARASYQRAKNLFETQGVSLGELQKREGEHKAAMSQQQAALGAREAAERKLSLLGMNSEAITEMTQSGRINSHYGVAAPIAGQVIERNVTLGQLVGPTNDALMVLADLTTLWVLADVPEAKLADVSVGSKARITVNALPGKAINGAVTFVASSLDPTTHCSQVRIDLKLDENAAFSTIKPGMFAQVEIESATLKNQARETIAVLEDAIHMIDGHPVVFVEDDDEENTFIKRPVAIGEAINGLVPIFSGLKEREKIVKSGGFILKAEFAKSAVKDSD